jgi:Ca-activated chloride channel family protein
MAVILRRPALWIVVAALLGLLWAWSAAGRSFAGMWLTPDQQGAWLMRRQRYEEAAQRFRNPVRQGAALYRAGRFKDAAAAFARTDSPRAAYDRGNALVMAGKYADAIASYDRALERRPDWKKAKDNRELAQARLAMLAPPSDGSEGTDQVKPDEVVFDDRAKNAGAQRVETTGGASSDADALWLRRIQTKPADFLRAKFAYQLSRRQPGQASP